MISHTTLSKTINVSFEFFPPKNKQSLESLWDNIKRLEPLDPKFISVTYGAGGSIRNNTHSLVKEIKQKTSLNPAAHLTCLGTSKAEIESIAEDYWNSGIKHIVALRGDERENKTKNKFSDFTYATDLIKLLKKKFDFEITVFILLSSSFLGTMGAVFYLAAIMLLLLLLKFFIKRDSFFKFGVLFPSIKAG